jgi:hypothetical protein
MKERTDWGDLLEQPPQPVSAGENPSTGKR